MTKSSLRIEGEEIRIVDNERIQALETIRRSVSGNYGVGVAHELLVYDRDTHSSLNKIKKVCKPTDNPNRDAGVAIGGYTDADNFHILRIDDATGGLAVENPTLTSVIGADKAVRSSTNSLSVCGIERHTGRLHTLKCDGAGRLETVVSVGNSSILSFGDVVDFTRDNTNIIFSPATAPITLDTYQRLRVSDLSARHNIGNPYTRTYVKCDRAGLLQVSNSRKFQRIQKLRPGTFALDRLSFPSNSVDVNGNNVSQRFENHLLTNNTVRKGTPVGVLDLHKDGARYAERKVEVFIQGSSAVPPYTEGWSVPNVDDRWSVQVHLGHIDTQNNYEDTNTEPRVFSNWNQITDLTPIPSIPDEQNDLNAGIHYAQVSSDNTAYHFYHTFITTARWIRLVPFKGTIPQLFENHPLRPSPHNAGVNTLEKEENPIYEVPGQDGPAWSRFDIFTGGDTKYFTDIATEGEASGNPFQETLPGANPSFLTFNNGQPARIFREPLQLVITSVPRGTTRYFNDGDVNEAIPVPQTGSGLLGDLSEVTFEITGDTPGKVNHKEELRGPGPSQSKFTRNRWHTIRSIAITKIDDYTPVNDYTRQPYASVRQQFTIGNTAGEFCDFGYVTYHTQVTSSSIE